MPDPSEDSNVEELILCGAAEAARSQRGTVDGQHPSGEEAYAPAPSSEASIASPWLASADNGGKFGVLELFSGQGGFAQEVRRRVPGAHVVGALDVYEGWDITTPEGFSAALRASDEAEFCHLAVPCKSFTRARRKDTHGTVPVVRNDERPGGWGHPAADSGNDIAKRAVAIASRMAQRRRWWSIENPADSFLFDYAPVAELARTTGATEVFLEQ